MFGLECSFELKLGHLVWVHGYACTAVQKRRVGITFDPENTVVQKREARGAVAQSDSHTVLQSRWRRAPRPSQLAALPANLLLCRPTLERLQIRLRHCLLD